MGKLVNCLLVGLLLGASACTAHRPVEEPPAAEQVRIVRVDRSGSMHAMTCNSFFGSVRLANDSDRTIRVTAVDLLTSVHHRVPIDLTLPPKAEASYDLTVARPGEPGRELLKLPGCRKLPKPGEPSSKPSFVSEAEYLD